MRAWVPSMGHINHFSAGAITPLLAYVVSCLGSALGLLSMQRARKHTGLSRHGWLALAAVSIGGTGVWVMHFVGMLGFSVSGTAVRYDLAVTLGSLGLAVAIVWVGLYTVVRYGHGVKALVSAGAITGVGVASMHYMGIGAMQLHGDLHFNVLFVVMSVMIAVVAATAALWFTVTVHSLVAVVGASALMGVAISGMHYVGMFGMDVTVTGGSPAALSGLDADAFFTPLTMVVSIVSALSLLGVAISANESEIDEDRWADEQLAKITAGRD